jgi:hypothetical protein
MVMGEFQGLLAAEAEVCLYIAANPLPCLLVNRRLSEQLKQL